MARILVIDDDPGVRESMTRMLRGAGYSVLAASSGEEGFDLARGDTFDVILSDMRMPGLSGLDVLRKLRDVNVDACFIVMTGFGTVDTAVEAMKLGAVDFVQKPFYRDELLMRVRAATDRRQLARQVTLLQRQLPASPSPEGFVGQSPAMTKVRDLIRRAAAAAGTVLVTGETGTGKELAARAIHAGSPRAAKPFVALNCAALDRVAPRERALRPFAWRLYRRGGRPSGSHRACRRRHALPRRDRHDDAGASGQAAARARIRRGPSYRREREPASRCPVRDRHQRGSQIRRRQRAPSATTSITASTSISCTCRRYASARVTSRCSSSISSSATAAPRDHRRRRPGDGRAAGVFLSRECQATGTHHSTGRRDRPAARAGAGRSA